METGQALFQEAAESQRYDFRRFDRIPNEQIRALRVIHDTFVRSLASSLSAYLRTYVSVDLISVEQMSFRDFMASLPSPTCIATLRITPFDGMSILEINPSLAFPLIEVMLGGGKIKPRVVEREMTDIERQILDSLLVLIVQNLSFSWQSVARVDMAVDGYETEPALLHILPPNEAIVTIATEIRIAEMSGMLNVGIPSSVVKLLRHRVDQQWSQRRPAVADGEQKMLARLADATFSLDARLEGSTVRFGDLLQLAEGEVLVLERGVGEPVTVSVNGRPTFEGQLTVAGLRKAVKIA